MSDVTTQPRKRWQDLSTRERVVALLAVLIVSFPVLHWGFERAFLTHTVTLKVTENDAAESCVRKRERRFRYSYVRSEKPNSLALDREGCGVIWTSHGTYKLPRTRRISIFETPRAELNAALTAGCSFNVTVIGSGGRPRAGAPARAPTLQRITNINRTLSCD